MRGNIESKESKGGEGDCDIQVENLTELESVHPKWG